MEIMRRLYSEEEGQGLVEYALIIGLISIIIIAVATTMGGAISAKFADITDALTP